MTDKRTYRSPGGRSLTDEDLDAIAADVATRDYDVGVLERRRRGRAPMGSGPAAVVPVRIDPEPGAAIAARAEADSRATS